MENHLGKVIFKNQLRNYTKTILLNKKCPNIMLCTIDGVFTNGLAAEKMDFRTYASSKDQDQPAHSLTHNLVYALQ